MKKNLLKNSGVQSLIASLVCIVLGLLIGYVVLLFINPAGAGEAIVTVVKNFFTYSKTETQMKYLGSTLVKSAPLLMCSLSILFAYKVGLFNIGAPGQYLMGAMTALLIALSVPKPENAFLGFLYWLLAFLAAIVAGMIWGAIPGLFKAIFNVNEVIVCIMTNWIAANAVSWVFSASGDKYINFAETKVNFIRPTYTNAVTTPKLGLDKLFPGSNIDISIFYWSKKFVL